MSAYISVGGLDLFLEENMVYADRLSRAGVPVELHMYPGTYHGFYRATNARVSEGHRVLHSTRHAPIEFGKDVVSIAPDRVPCAYQLKGNPGGRLTHSQFREIQPQLQELVTQAIPYAGLPDVHHRSYLVTNGFVEEEVQRAIQDLNRTGDMPKRPGEAPSGPRR